jgi:hypothetical protein
MPPEAPVSIAHRKTVSQIQFDKPRDFLLYLERHPELREQIDGGEWQWSAQQPEGGH